MHKDIIRDIESERRYQDAKWGGPEADDIKNGPIQWVFYICRFATRWFQEGDYVPHTTGKLKDFRRDMVKVAALAVAAIEQYDRAKRRDG